MSGLSIFFLVCGIVFVIIGILIFCVARDANSFTLATGTLILGFLFLLGAIVRSDFDFKKDYQAQYEQKIKAVQKAEKELQIFLIDHPEFKESEAKK